MKNTYLNCLSLSLVLIFTGSCAQKALQTETQPTTAITSGLNEAPPSPDSPQLTKLKIADLVNKSRTEKYSDTLALDVYYATNRATTGDTANCSDDTFGVKVSEQLSYGACRINIPKRHATGKIDVATDARSDSHRFFKVLQHRSFDFENFQKNISKNPSQEILVFVHGFNVKFQEAVLRAGQIAYDLKFQGSIVLFSWPAGPESGMLNSALISRTYGLNKKNAQASIEGAIDFFDMLSRLERRINIYVHSMGHQVVIPALVRLARDSDVKLLVDELILNAPDYDLKEFINFSTALTKLAKRITLYCSYNDSAMTASETYNGVARLGACEVVDGIDVINVSEIDNPSFGMGLGHAYYSSRAVLADVAQLMMGIEAENRLFIRKSEPNSTENYYLRP